MPTSTGEGLPGEHHLHEHRSVSGGLARAAVFGISDGLLSNVSLVLGFAGGGASAHIVRLAGIAGLVAGAFSMASGEYISVSAQNELIERELDIERRNLVTFPEAEHAELAGIFESRGVARDLAHQVAADLMREPEQALSAHAREELGIDPRHLNSPWGAALASFFAFALGALLPVLPWFFSRGHGATIASVVIGIIVATLVGSLIGLFADRSRVKSAFRQVAFLIVAVSATYAIGKALGVGITG
jgi:VIT1/CCC1 family predicted Fe2+/Mn2+ transporter